MAFGWGLPMLLLWALPFVLLFYALKGSTGNRQPSARDLLDQAYARGDLPRDEYLRRRADIAQP